MDFTYLLVGLGAFLVASSRASAATPQAPQQPQQGQPLTLTPPNTKLPLDVRVAIIRNLFQNQIPNFDYVPYAISVGQRESGGDYRPAHKGAAAKGYVFGMNQLGYSGMYQMGAQALESAGYIKRGTWATPGTGAHFEILTSKNPSYWTEKCPNGIEQFMNTPAIQEAAMLEMTLMNYRGLKRAGVLTDSSPPDVKGGYIAAAHISGVGGASKLHRGIVTADGNGTPNDKYYQIGAATQVASRVG